MNDGWMIGLVLLIMIPVVLISTVIPFLTRKIESFGVTIPEEAQEDTDISALRRQYLWVNGGLGVIITASLLLFSVNVSDENKWSLILLLHLLVYMIASFAIYLRQHRAVKALKHRKQWLTDAVQRVVVDTSFRKQNLTVSYAWFIPHILLIIATVLIGVLGYDRFPDPIPMKYGLDGEVIRSVAKSYSAVLWPAVTQAILLIIFIFVNYSIGRSKQIVEASDPDGSLRRNILFRRRWSGYMTLSSFVLIALFTTIQLSQMLGWGSKVMIIVTFIVVGFFLIGTIGLSFATGQGGSRIKLKNGSTGKSVPAADQDQYWKLGQFYFNPGDPSFFVEKRFGIGWTVNFGRPIVWIIFIAIIALPLLSRLFIKG